MTVSHLRFGAGPIDSTYLIDDAAIVVSSQFLFAPAHRRARAGGHGATVLLNCPYPVGEVWDALPVEPAGDPSPRAAPVRHRRRRVAHEAGLDGHTGSIMLPSFLSLAGIMPDDQMMPLSGTPSPRSSAEARRPVVAATWPRSSAPIAGLARGARAGRGDRDDASAARRERRRARLRAARHRPDARRRRRPPAVSALPSTAPSRPAPRSTRSAAIATEMPVWDPTICIDCGKCAIVCPHAAIRMKVVRAAALEGAPAAFPTRRSAAADLTGHRLTIQVAPDDCTGCGVCVDVCPATDKSEVRRKAHQHGAGRDRARASSARAGSSS